MIYIFRKEMRKWHAVLWVVFGAMAISGVSFIFMKPGRGDVKVGWVNGDPIYFGQYKSAIQDYQMRIESIKNIAKMYGISEEIYLKMLGLGDPAEVALDACIRERLLDGIQHSFNIKIGDKFFKEEIVKTMPQGILDENGRINIEAYQYYLSKLAVTPSDFEEKRRDDMKRDVVSHFMGVSYYLPSFAAKELYIAQNTKKSFYIADFSLDRFLSEVKKTQLTEKELTEFYQANKDNYRIPEKKKAKYWTLSVGDYSKKIEIDEEAIKAFYEKNKSSLFRIPPKVKVRHILIKLGAEASKGLKVAQDVLKQAKTAPNTFADLAKKYSQDVASAKNGGLLDFFGRKTYDATFETAAFRLKNKGDVSDLVKTSTGYEIIQLVDRIAAAEKPLESVKDEILKAIKTRKTTSAIRGDVEIMLHDLRTDASALSTFVKKNGLEAKETGWMSAKNADEKGLEGQLAQKLFGQAKKGRDVGYFNAEGSYIIYQVSSVEKSFVPPLNSILSEVTQALQNKKAQKLMESIVKESKLALLNKKTTLQGIAQRLGLQLSATEMVAVNDKIKEVADSQALLPHMFELNDLSQVLVHEYEKGIYVIQLKEMGQVDETDFEKEKGKIIKNEKIKGENAQVRAFIASLQRNAKIDIDQKVVNMTKGNVRDF